jgi:flavorubredoxin
MGKVLVAYVTRSGDTEEMANIIAEGIRFTGHEATVMNITRIKNEKEIEGYDGYAFGSPTYHGEMTQGMKKFLFMAEKANLEGKVGGAFGAFGWSGEAPDRVYDTMENIFKMDMVRQPLRLKTISLGGGVKMAQDYGREIGQKLG